MVTETWLVNLKISFTREFFFFFYVYPPQPISHSFTMSSHNSFLLIGYRGAQVPFLNPKFPLNCCSLLLWANEALSTHVIFIGCKSLCRLMSSHSVRGFDWKWSKQNEPKWTKVNQSEPKKKKKKWPKDSLSFRSRLWRNLIWTLSILPLSSFFSRQVTQIPPQKKTALLFVIHHAWSQNMIYWLSCIHQCSASKITQQSPQYLPRPTQTRPVRGRSIFLKNSNFYRLRRSSSETKLEGREVLWHKRILGAFK